MPVASVVSKLREESDAVAPSAETAVESSRRRVPIAAECVAAVVGRRSRPFSKN